MPKQLSKLPEIVFLPSKTDTPDFKKGRLQDFLEDCREGYTSSWTCKRTARAGDVYLFWFTKPAEVIAGLGIAVGNVFEKRNVDFDWTASEKCWFSAFDPLIELQKKITLDQILADRLLARWWSGRPFFGRPKRLELPIARKLARLILAANPKNERLEWFLSRYAVNRAKR